MISCYHGHVNIVKILLDNGADIIAEDSVPNDNIHRIIIFLTFVSSLGKLL